MSLINCPECGQAVSNEAIACPNCGRPFSAPTPVVQKRVVITEPDRSEFPKWVIVPIVILVAVLIFFAFSLTGDDTTEEAKRTNVNVSVPQKSGSLKETKNSTENIPNQIEVPASSTTVMPSSPQTVSPSTTQNIPPSTQTEVANIPSDKGVVVIDAKIISKSGAVQNVKNEKFYLLDKDLESILSDADLEPIESQTLSNSFGLAILYPEKYAEFKREALNEINKHIKYDALTDGSGKASIKEIKPDDYYLFGITKSANGFAIWSSSVNIISGENKLNLSPARLNEISGRNS